MVRAMERDVVATVFLPIALGVIMLGLGLSLQLADFKRVIQYPRAVVVAGDFMSPGTGVLSKLEVDELKLQQNVLASAVQGDPALRQYDGKLYVINRFGGNNITAEFKNPGAPSSPLSITVTFCAGTPSSSKRYEPMTGVLPAFFAVGSSITVSSGDRTRRPMRSERPPPRCLDSAADNPSGSGVPLRCGVSV